MTRILSTLILLLFACFSFAQSTIVKGSSLKTISEFHELNDQFYESEVYQIDVESFDDFVKEGASEIIFELQLGDDHALEIHMEPRDVRHIDYTLRRAGEDGTTEAERSENITFRGHVTSPMGGSVALAVDEDLILGFFEMGGTTYFIEPLWYFVPNQPRDLFVVYKESDLKPNAGVCGVHEVQNFKDKHPPHEILHDQPEMMGCVEVELAVASDFEMFQKYGTAGAVEAHILGILNAVQTNFDDEFNDEIQFFIITQFTVTSNADDPWTNSNNAGTLLGDFRSWGNSGGFGVPFDLAELWTARPMNGVFGIAYLNSVCGFSRYHVVRDYSTNLGFVQKTTAHEIGHNFSGTHDPPGSGNIMSQGAFSSSTWSNNSQNQINGFYPGLGCLGTCITSQPPVASFTVNPSAGCVPFTVTYQDQSVGATDWQWTFPGGVPSTSTDQNPTVTYNIPGNFGATLFVSNPAGGNTLSQNDIVFVETEPVAAFNFTLNGLTIVFENASSPNATEYLWDFGDNNTSTEENPTHTYAEDGFYDITLTASNGCGMQSLSLQLPAFDFPTAGFSASPAEGCAALNVEFTNNSSSNVLNFFWEFDGGTPATSTEENPTVTYATPGTYTASLTVTNPTGADTETQTDVITVGTLPVPGFNFTVDGNTVTFENTADNSEGIGAMTFEWDFGDMNSSTEEDPVHTFMGNGDFEVTLFVTNDCGTSELTQTISIEAPPTAGFTASSTSGCEPFEVSFNNTSSANATEYNWDFPGGDPTTSTLENPTVTYSMPGTYDVTLIVSNGLGADTIFSQNHITVAALATSSFSSSADGPTVTFTNTSSNATSYLWDFGDTNTSTETNPVHTYSETGSFTVTLTATNDCGSIMTTQTVMAVTLPSANFSANTLSGCAPHTVQFTNESSENASSFLWDFPGGDPISSTEENPSVTYENAGTYSVTLTVTNAAGESTFTENNYIEVLAGPTAGFSSSVNSFTANFSNSSLNATSYEWDFGDMSAVSTESDPEHAYAEDGIYTVTLTATNTCGTDVFTQTVEVTSLPQAVFSASQTSGCALFEVSFTNESSENSTSFEWVFPGGTPNSSTAENPTVTYASPGAYTVTLTAINGLGESMVTQTDYILVGDGPSAIFSADENLLMVAFTNASTNPAHSGNLTYEWDFGDTNESMEASPVHTYSMDGTYEVTLTVFNDCGSSTFTQTVNAVSVPTAGFSASQNTGCAPFEVEFVNESSENATSFEWEFQGGSPASSSAENPTVTYDSPGTYSVTLTASNAAGEDEISFTDYIVVGAAPSASFSSAQDLLTVMFTNETVNPANSGNETYEWDFGDMSATSTEANPEHTYAMDGNYEVTLTVTNDCGTDFFTQTVGVGTFPSASFTAQSNSGCVPFVVEFTSTSTANAEEFEWSFPGGDPATSSEENPVVTYNFIGTFDVTLTVSNAQGSDSQEELGFINVNDVPSANFDTDVNDNIVDFNNTSMNATSFEWDFGDMNTSAEASPQHTYSEDGAYTVTLTATNECGSVTTEEVVIVATPGQAPVAAFSSENREGCAPLEVSFMNLSSANATEYEWTFTGGEPAFSSEENPTVIYNIAGTYDVTLVASNMNGSDTFEETAYVTVGGLPTAGFTSDVNMQTVTFSNTSTNAVNSGTMTFEWNFGDNNTTDEENPVHTYAEPGEYTVTLTVSNDCGISASTTTVVIMVNSLIELPGISVFDIYPNPNQGNFILILEGQAYPELEITFTNILGQIHLNQSVDFRSGSLRKEFAFNDLAAGTYIVKIASGNKILHRKIIVE